MGSTPALTSSIASNNSVFSPVNFSGGSSYSSELQQVLSRAVAIAQLPVRQLQNDQADVETKIQGLQKLNPSVAAVAADLQTLGQLGAGGALSASSSNPSLVSVTATGATSSATYMISNISSVASAASATSRNVYSGAASETVSAAGNLQLVVGGQSYSITLGSGQNNLQGLVAAVNNIPNGPVSASVLTTQSGDYLALSANATGQLTALQLDDVAADGSTTNLLNTSGAGLNLGSNATFDLDGIHISQSSNTINNVIGGMTFTILGTTSSADPSITLSVSQDAAPVSTALQTLVNDYNSLAAALDNQIGPSGGALGGSSILFQIEHAMQQLVTYGSANGSVKSLYDLGITLDHSGKMTFDPTALSVASSTQLSSALNFLGSASSGLGAFAATFSQISDPVSGLIEAQTTSYAQQDQKLQNRVDQANQRITSMETSMQLQLEKADAAISSLQSQQQVVTSTVQSVYLALYGQNFGSAITSGR